jgi:hypothetical protein
MGMACVLSECEDDRGEVAQWLRSFMRGVDYKIETGSLEMESLTDDEKKIYWAAFNKTASGKDYLARFEETENVQHPSLRVDEDSDVSDGEKGEDGVLGGESVLSDEEDDFWNPEKR